MTLFEVNINTIWRFHGSLFSYLDLWQRTNHNHNLGQLAHLKHINARYHDNFATFLWNPDLSEHFKLSFCSSAQLKFWINTTLYNRRGIIRRSLTGPKPYDAFQSAADHTTLFNQPRIIRRFLTSRGSHDPSILMCRIVHSIWCSRVQWTQLFMKI